jgi:hypothetical protein
MTDEIQRYRPAPGEVRRRVTEEVTNDSAYLKEMTLDELHVEHAALAANLALLQADISSQDPSEPARGKDWLRRARHGAIYARAALKVCGKEISARLAEREAYRREEAARRTQEAAQQKAERRAAHQQYMLAAQENRRPKTPPPAPNPEKQQRKQSQIGRFVTVAHSMLPEETLAAIWAQVKADLPE